LIANTLGRLFLLQLGGLNDRFGSIVLKNSLLEGVVLS